VTFTAKTNGPNDNVAWVLLGYADSGANEGSPHSAFGSTFVYTAPPTPPIYPIPTVPQGSVPLQVSEGYATVQFNIPITAPNVTTGFFEVPTNTVALGKTINFGAYAVGNTNNAVTMQVNGITGGSTTYGTITPINVGLGTYIYTAPATMPMTGNTVTVTVISVADPTKSSSMTITLTSS
jgi:hypothetical protein